MHGQNPRPLSLALLLCLAACDGGTGNAPATRKTPVRAQPGEPATEVAPSPTPAPPPAAQPDPAPVEAPEPVAAPEPQPEPAPGPTFHAVGLSETVAGGSGLGVARWRVFRVGPEVFAAVGPRVMQVGPDGNLVEDRAWLRGLAPAIEASPSGAWGLMRWEVEVLGGRWPSGLYAVFGTDDANRKGEEPDAAYRYTAEGWAPLEMKDPYVRWLPTRLAEWKDASVLATRQVELGSADPEEIEALGGDMEEAVANTKRFIVIRGAPKSPKITSSDLASFDALPSGEIFGLLTGTSPKVAHFDPITEASMERALPPATLQRGDVLARSRDRAFVFGEAIGGTGTVPYLARWDGRGWVAESVPACAGQGLASFSEVDGAGQWAVCSVDPRQWQGAGTLWHREEGGEWENVALPEGGTARDVVARGPDDVWVAGDRLYHSTAKTPLPAVGLDALWYDVLEAQPPSKVSACKVATVLVKAAPAGDHGGLIAALSEQFTGWKRKKAEVSLVEVDFQGAPRLALQVTQGGGDAQRKIGKALGDLEAETYCVQRPATRELGTWSGPS